MFSCYATIHHRRGLSRLPCLTPSTHLQCAECKSLQLAGSQRVPQRCWAGHQHAPPQTEEHLCSSAPLVTADRASQRLPAWQLLSLHFDLNLPDGSWAFHTSLAGAGRQPVEIIRWKITETRTVCLLSLCSQEHLHLLSCVVTEDR